MISVQYQVMIKPSNGLTINEPALSHNGVIFVEHHQKAIYRSSKAYFFTKKTIFYTTDKRLRKKDFSFEINVAY